NDSVVIRRGNELRAFRLDSVATIDVVVRPASTGIPAATTPATRITLDPDLPLEWLKDARRLSVHFDLKRGGKLTRVAKTELNTSDFALPGLSLEGPVEPLPEGVAKPGELLLLDAQDNGAFANGTVDIDSSGAGRVHFNSGNKRFSPSLRTPVTVFGNLVAATRGESVFNETLGSGDASQALQFFKLAKHPLTYINDASAANGRRSTLEIRVNGILWKEVSSFFGAAPDSEVYTVRQNDDGESSV